MSNEAVREVTIADVRKSMVISVETSHGIPIAHVFIGNTPRAQFSIQFPQGHKEVARDLKHEFPFAKIEKRQYEPSEERAKFIKDSKELLNGLSGCTGDMARLAHRLSQAIDMLDSE